MLDLSPGKVFVLALAALFVLGPERLPEAAAWLGRNLRWVREFAQGANEKIRAEIGPEFDEIRAPLRELRGELGAAHAWRSPRQAMTRYLLDDPIKPIAHAPRPGESAPGVGRAPAPAPRPSLAAGERPPSDPDAT